MYMTNNYFKQWFVMEHQGFPQDQIAYPAA